MIYLLLLSLLSFYQANAAGNWDYSDLLGWGEINPICNTGWMQSPVDLKAGAIGINDGQPLIQLTDYYSPPEVTIENTGHSIQMYGKWEGLQPKISGSMILNNEVYVFQNVHLHLSTANYSDGTEHAINGKRFAVELHLVHINQKYRNFEEAAKRGDGLLVVAILCEFNEALPPNPGVLAFSKLAEFITEPKTSYTSTDGFEILHFIPDGANSFYHYPGSLTVPPCVENVRWVVLAEPIPVNTKIMNRFSSVHLPSMYRGSTVRPLLELNNRVIVLYSQ